MLFLFQPQACRGETASKVYVKIHTDNLNKIKRHYRKIQQQKYVKAIEKRMIEAMCDVIISFFLHTELKLDNINID